MVDLFADDLEPTQEVYTTTALPCDRPSAQALPSSFNAAVATQSSADAAAGAPASDGLGEVRSQSAAVNNESTDGIPATAAELAVPGLTALSVMQRARSIMQAEAIVRTGGIVGLRRTCVGGHQGVMASAKGSTPGVVYSLRMPSAESGTGDVAVRCTCPDYVQRGGLCKHGAALLLVLVPGSGYIAPDSVQASAPGRVLPAKIEPGEALTGKIEPGGEWTAKIEPGGALTAKMELRETSPVKSELAASPSRTVQPGVAEVKRERVLDAPPAYAPPLPPPSHSPQAALLPPQPISDASLEAKKLAAVSQIPKRRKLPASFSQRCAAPVSGEHPAGPAPDFGEGLPGRRGDSSPSRRGAEALFDDANDDGQAVLLPPPAKRARVGASGSRARAYDAGNAEAPPIRAPTAYQIFLRTARANGGAVVRWRDLLPEERRPYEEAAVEERMRLEAERQALAMSGRDVANGMEERLMTGNPFGLQSPDARLQPAPPTLPAAAASVAGSLPATFALAATPPAAFAAASQAASSSTAAAPDRVAAASAAAPERSTGQQAFSEAEAEPCTDRHGLAPRGLCAQLDMLMFPDDDSQEEALPAATRQAVVAAAAAAVSAPPDASVPSAKATAVPSAASQTCHIADTATAVSSQTQRAQSPVRRMPSFASRASSSVAAAAPPLGASASNTMRIPENSGRETSWAATTRSAAAAEQALGAEWHCPQCTLINKAASTHCDACGAARPSEQRTHQVTPPAAKPAPATPTLWTASPPAAPARQASPPVSLPGPKTSAVPPVVLAATTPAPASVPTRVSAPASTSPARPLISFFDRLKELD